MSVTQRASHTYESARDSRSWSPDIRAALRRFRPERKKRGAAITFVVVRVSRLLMQRLNETEFIHLERFERAHRSGRGLLTLANHVSIADDPLLPSCFVSGRWAETRWTAVDALNFFSSPLMATLFNAGKGVPVVRGGGIHQPGVEFMKQRLLAGDWVHVFPEGTRTRRDDARMGSLKPGFAHLIQTARPLVLPFHHRGMRDVLPVGGRLPKIGQSVTVRFGETVDSRQGLADRSIAEIVDWGEAVFGELEDQALAAT
ncbi:MAG: 1-acyl-sn-glycerol-3-phosphate acyltransferase [Deltaproteobacteria bacterium]|nr:1-acyl-sn-glycerol-3-phosphate acyltransferase [Deltaproteobacteria bacterium]